MAISATNQTIHFWLGSMTGCRNPPI